MLSSSAIHKHNQEAKEKASRMGKEPYVIHSKENVMEMEQFPFPNIGDLRPDGWELEKKYFVSKMAGSEPGPALSHKSFRSELQDDQDEDGIFGYAIVEEGQFQLYVGKFRKVE